MSPSKLRKRSSTADPAARVLIVERDGTVAGEMSATLVNAGYDVRRSANAGDALRQVKAMRPDIVLLDVMLPRLNGFEVCRRLRLDPATSDIGVIIVTEQSAEEVKLLGFEAGADDCVTKPFSPRELLARIRAVLRRHREVRHAEGKHHLTAGPLEIDRLRFEVRAKGRPVKLTRKEFDLLATLVGTPGRVFGREELLGLIWGRDGFVGPRTVDVHLARLRRKFISARVLPPQIATIRGVGYRFRDSGAD